MERVGVQTLFPYLVFFRVLKHFTRGSTALIAGAQLCPAWIHWILLEWLCPAQGSPGPGHSCCPCRLCRTCPQTLTNAPTNTDGWNAVCWVHIGRAQHKHWWNKNKSYLNSCMLKSHGIFLPLFLKLSLCQGFSTPFFPPSTKLKLYNIAVYMCGIGFRNTAKNVFSPHSFSLFAVEI